MRVFVYNLISSLATVIGAISIFVIGNRIESSIAFLTALVAGGLLYIAASDLLPQIAKEEHFLKVFIQIILLLAGIGVIFAVGQITNV